MAVLGSDGEPTDRCDLPPLRRSDPVRKLKRCKHGYSALFHCPICPVTECYCCKTFPRRRAVHHSLLMTFRPTHLIKPKSLGKTACGHAHVMFYTKDLTEVTCQNCRKTRVFKDLMHTEEDRIAQSRGRG